MKTVSVILTTYNAAKTLQRAIDSVRNQEGTNELFQIEWLIVDDGSTDATISILEENQLPFTRNKKNSGGPNKGRNIGLSAATGDFICIMDHDDEWKTGKLQEQLAFTDQALIISSGYTLIDTDQNRTVERIPTCKQGQKTRFYPKNKTFLTKLTKEKGGQETYIGSLLFSASLKQITFEETYGMVDYDWIVRLFENNNSAEVCESLYNRYVDGSNLSLNENYRLKDFDYSLKTAESYASQFPSAARKAVKRIHGTMARYYYVMEKMPQARKHFKQSEVGLKTMLYFVTTFAGHRLVKRYFNVFS